MQTEQRQICRLKQKKMRIDVYLFQIGLASSRTDAKRMISEGEVYVNGKRVLKPSLDVSEADGVTVKGGQKKYVSRGGLKLEAALREFSVNAEGKLCIDIGASSGGFTDCLLQNGAEHVIALDSGSLQLVDSLRNDGRVTCVENYNARYLNLRDLIYKPEIAVMDVSFISATYIIKPIYDCLADGADFICLVKPQFEVGKSGLSKGGIVKDDKLRMSAVNKVIDFSKNTGFTFVSFTKSPIEGGDGNIEYLAHFRK